MENQRVKKIIDTSVNQEGKYVLYWMQQSQRIQYNHALNFAIERANELGISLLVYFGVADGYPDANDRHYQFMLEGILEIEKNLTEMGIGFVIYKGLPQKEIRNLVTDACEIVFDKGYLKLQRQWREEALEYIRHDRNQNTYEIESDLVVPVESASNKLEYSARTIRNKVMNKLEENLTFIDLPDINVRWNGELKKEGLKIKNINVFLKTLNIDHSVCGTNYFRGGETEAHKKLDQFIIDKLEHYSDSSNPSNNYCSKISPYLHFGQISPIHIIIKLRRHMYENPEINSISYNAFIEQLVVRRELAFNYVYYNHGYDKFETMTDAWAYETMAIHSNDEREYVYTLEQMENLETHDRYFNAAMYEAKVTGIMHNYMRMYWCKKIVEWSKNYKEAYKNAIYLNNKYFIDGRDAGSYTGIAWCFGKHDHGWNERSVFGKLRYMNDKGLERKFNMDEYISRLYKIKDNEQLK